MTESKKYRRKKDKAAILIFAVLSFACLFPASIAAHRFHTSLTRIDYNVEQKSYEITIRLFTHDLVPILEKRAGKRVDLEKSPDADKLILDYLNENFSLTDKKDAIKTLNWVGREIEIDTIRVYLETAATESLEGVKLKNTIFLQNFPEQTNLVVCQFDGQKADLLFKSGDKIKEIVANKVPVEETK